jgi:hypothetical protein
MKKIAAALPALLVVMAIGLFGCSSNDPVEVRELYISDVGSLVEVHEYEDGTVAEYIYQGVTFLGDIAVSEYEHALGVVEPLYSEFEVLLKVTNGRVFPGSQTHWIDAPADGYTLTTCTADAAVYCDEGKTYIFSRTSDGYGLLPIIYWQIIP